MLTLVGFEFERKFPVTFTHPGPRCFINFSRLRRGSLRSRRKRKAHERYRCEREIHRSDGRFHGMNFLSLISRRRKLEGYQIAGENVNFKTTPCEASGLWFAILGVALPDARARYAETVRRLRRRFVLPSHQEDFFRPLVRGFAFGLLTDFPRMLREDEREKLPGRLFLLDYFRPWTLP
ncbi:MAG: hypothetical protein ABIU29_11400 [Chthoniobacterales bacterium]